MTDLFFRFGSFLSDLRRRRVFRVALGYLVVSWMVIEASALILPELNLPEWAPRLVLGMAILGLVPTVFLAYVFDLTPEGLRRTDANAEREADPRGVGVASAPLGDPPGPGRGGSSAGTGDRPGSGSRWAALRRRSGTVATSDPAERRRESGAGGDSERVDLEPAVTIDPERLRRAAVAHERHELRTPINAIVGYSEMLLEDHAGDSATEVVGALRDVRAVGDELLRQIEETHRGAEEVETLVEARARLRERAREPIARAREGIDRALTAAGAAGVHGLDPDLERIRTALSDLERRLEERVAPETAKDGSSPGEEARLAEAALQWIRPAGADAEEGALTNASLLVVDDSETNRRLIARLLAQRGYTVSAASGGEEGLALLRERTYDLALLDIMMPGTNGIEVLRQMRAAGSLAATPVIMMSALDEMDSVLRCVEMGAQDYLVKPLDPVLLRARVEANLRYRRMLVRQQEVDRQLADERAAVDRLARSILPAGVAERFLAGEPALADSFAQAGTLVVEIDGISRATASLDPREAAAMLGAIRERIEGTLAACTIEPVRGSGWVYRGMTAARGGEARSADGGAAVALDAALKVAAEVEQLARGGGLPLRVRGGVHVGPVCAGVTGSARPLYEIWGEGLEVAQGLAGLAPEGCVLVSSAVQAVLREQFAMENHGIVEIGGLGQLRAFRAVGRSVKLAAPIPAAAGA